MRKVLLLAFLLVGTLTYALSEEELFTEAEAHYRVGNYLLALESYEELLKQYPLSDRVADVQYRRGVCLFRLGRNREALEVFAEIERRYRTTRYFDYIYFWRGVGYYRIDDYSRAVDSLRTFLARRSDAELEPQALLYTGLAEIGLKDYQEATSPLRALVNGYFHTANGPYGLILLLFSYLKQDRYQELLEEADGFSAAQIPEKWRSRYSLYRAEALWKTGKQEEAGRIYATLLQAKPEVAAVAFRRLFMAAQAADNLAEMERLIGEAESRFAGSPVAVADLLVQAGIESYQQGNLELAQYFLGKVWSQPAGQTVPEAVPLYLAEIRIRKGQLEEAARALEAAQKRVTGGSALALLRLADVRRLQGDFDSAAALYERFLEAYPDSEQYAEAGYLLAYCRYRLGREGDALELAYRLLQKYPQSGYRKDLYRLAAVLEGRQGNFGKAVGLLDRYLALYPDDLKVREEVLKLLFRQKSYREVLVRTERLFRSFPDLKERSFGLYVLASYLRGLAAVSAKEYQVAVAALTPIDRAAAERAGLSVITPYALYYRGWASYRLKEYRKALADLVEYLGNYAGNPLFYQALFLAGWCSFSAEDYTGAVAYFSRLAKAGSDLAPRAAFLQGKSLENLGNLDEAERVFQGVMKSFPSSAFTDDALFEAAGVQARRGQTRLAADTYREVWVRFPASPLAEEALYKRGELLYAAKLYAQARDAFYDYRTTFPDGRLVDASLYWGGMAADQIGEKFGAVLLWERLIEGYPQSPFRADSLKRTADAYADRGDYRKALTLMRQLDREYPEEARAFNASRRISELQLLLQGLSRREAELSSTIGQEGGAATARGREAMLALSRLYIYEQTGKMDLAYQMLRSVVEKKKEDSAAAAQAQYLIGEYHYRKGDLVQAAQDFLEAAYLNPADQDRMAASIYRAAEMMVQAGRRGDAQELVARLEEHFPDSQWTVEGRKLLQGGGA